MSNSYYEKGANHYDHHKELHIDTVNGGDIGKLISAFFKDDAEDAVIVGEEKEVKKPKKATGSKPEKPRETMTFGRRSAVTEGHIVLLGMDRRQRSRLQGSILWEERRGLSTDVERFVWQRHAGRAV